ncbi:MAG: hypothetical protein LBH59_10080 [Planctomycetaceae bacterium]|jgi:uncharacterized repeat protein (TIGR01451 family)|nr:hypothetical protein [Planctomycetaceae bacterium]
MNYQIIRESYFVLFFLAVLSMLSGGCFQQHYHNPVDSFAVDPVLISDERSKHSPIPISANNNQHQINQHPIAFAPQPKSIQNTPNQIATSTANLLPPPVHEVRQVTSTNNTVQNNYRYNNSDNNNYQGKFSTSPNNSTGDASMRVSNNQALVIRQVSSQNQQDNSGDSSITIDPFLSELGARVVAERNNGDEKFNGSWRPAAQYGFWPNAEYLVDGGDAKGHVSVDSDWMVRNLDVGDTAAHYDTVDGRTLVEASNKVHIYAPRFGAVRKVEGVVSTDHSMVLGAMNQQLRVDLGKSAERVGQTAQEFTAGYTRSRDDLHGVRSRDVGAGLKTNEGVSGYQNTEGVISYSETLCLKDLGSAEIIHLAEGCQNADEWQAAEGVKVKASYKVPMSMSAEKGVGQLFKVDDSGVSDRSKLRLIKVASKSMAKSGDIIEFTLRFDNLGTEPLGNITIMDNLTTRLEFVSGSAVSSVPSGFVVEPNGVSSFTLRFEITDPLEAGKFGIIQFRCRVL